MDPRRTAIWLEFWYDEWLMDSISELSVAK